jgi:DNA-binding MarR family transcriptional regulator
VPAFGIFTEINPKRPYFVQISMTNENIDTEFVILENIYDSSEQEIPLRQRDLARIAGASLGMTNSILKRLAKRGWISIKKLNNRNIQYAITFDGMNEIIHRSYRYFKRTLHNIIYYKDRIDEVILKAKKNNCIAVLLVGLSDLEFIVEHACQYYGLSFLKTANPDTASNIPEENILKVYSENIPVTGNPESAVNPLQTAFVRTVQRNSLYLSRMILTSAEKSAGLVKNNMANG